MLGKLSALEHLEVLNMLFINIYSANVSLDEVRVAPPYCSLSLLSLLVLIIINPTVRIRGITVSLGNFQLSNCRWRLKEMKKDQ